MHQRQQSSTSIPVALVLDDNQNRRVAKTEQIYLLHHYTDPIRILGSSFCSYKLCKSLKPNQTLPNHMNIDMQRTSFTDRQQCTSYVITNKQNRCDESIQHITSRALNRHVCADQLHVHKRKHSNRSFAFTQNIIQQQ